MMQTYSSLPHDHLQINLDLAIYIMYHLNVMFIDEDIRARDLSKVLVHDLCD